MLKTLEFIKSFVGNYIPFIGHKRLPMKPLIRLEKPFIVASGFTLIELMVTLAVVAILTLVAVPNMRSIIQNERMISLANDLVSDINLAKSEAVKRASNVVICTSASGTACDGGGNWTGKRITFADTNGNGVVDAGEVILRVREAMANNTLTTASPSLVPDPLVFSLRGLTNISTSTPAAFRLCDSRGPSAGRLISIGFVGTITIATSPGSC